MVRFVGVMACALALIVPAPSGVRSAPGSLSFNALRPRPPTSTALPPPAPFVSPHARSQKRGRTAQLRRSGHPTAIRHRQLVLTFDDGPDLATTPLVLEELDRHGVKAAFFVAGRRLIGNSAEAKARRELLRDIASRGHLIANHTVRHKHLCKQPELIDHEIDENQAILTRLLGTPPKLFRPPFGARCPELDAAIRSKNLISVGWTIDPQDWRPQPPEEVLAYVQKRVKTMTGNGVLLMHDTHSTGVKALPLVLAWIAQEQARAQQAKTGTLTVPSPWVLIPSRVNPPPVLEPLAEELVEELAGELRLIPLMGASMPKWLLVARR